MLFIRNVLWGIMEVSEMYSEIQLMYSGYQLMGILVDFEFKWC